MKYKYYPGPTDAKSRTILNEKVLYLIDSKTAAQADITNEDIYNAYSGDGGLHGLKRSDYDNYHNYSEAKKEIENGQFFTPPELCQLVAESLKPSQFDLIADLTCGKGSFFNFFPMESNLYGCELDVKACKVACFHLPTLLQAMSVPMTLNCVLTLWWGIPHSTSAGGRETVRRFCRSYTTA